MRNGFLWFVSLTIFSFPWIVQGQGLNNLWLFGYDNQNAIPWGGSRFDFSGGQLAMSYDPRLLSLDFTNGLISDKSGQLLFLSNGIEIQDRNNQLMTNGDNLNPDLFTQLAAPHGLNLPQANVVLPFPNDSTKYYLFHLTMNDYGNTYCSFYLYYSVVDMTRNGGLGEVTLKNIVLLQDSIIAGRLTACKHANGRDWWLISHKNNSSVYIKYLITPAGIQGPYTQDIGEMRSSYYFGQVSFSPDGNFYAYYEPTMGDLDLFDFDRCTGDFTLKAHVDINDSAISGGVAFSPNSQVLYVSSSLYLYQFDITAGNIGATQTTVGVYDGFFSPTIPLAANFNLCQLAPDGKIYMIAGNGVLDMHVINEPDSLGLACNFVQHSIHLTTYNGRTIPNYPNYFLGPKHGTICDSLSLGISDMEGYLSLDLFPNPVIDNKLTIHYTALPAHGILRINSIQGDEILEINLPPWSGMINLKLPDVSPGLYVVSLSFLNEKTTKKMFVK